MTKKRKMTKEEVLNRLVIDQPTDRVDDDKIIIDDEDDQFEDNIINNLSTNLEDDPTPAPPEPPVPEPLIKPMNPDAINYVGWFMSDARNMQQWSMQIFGNDVTIGSAHLTEIKDATNKSLTELEDDIATLRQYLAEYEPAPSHTSQ